MSSTPAKRRITQDDVARAAKVSRSTVSLIINGRSEGQIPDETRHKVLRVIKEMGYSPNVAARMLAQGTNRLIGVFTYAPRFPYEADNFFYPFLLGIERQATLEDYNLLLFTRRSDGQQRSIYREGANVLGMADGAILMGSHPRRNEIQTLVAEGRPFVYLGRRDVAGCEFDWVSSDYMNGSSAATQHLLDRGHRRIGFIGYESNEEPYHDRLAGCRRATDALPGASLYILPEQHLGDDRATLEFVRSTGVTACIATGTGVLATLLGTLLPAGWRIPEDLSVVAVSDEAAEFPAGLSPSHVRLNSTEVGAEAVRLLVERIEGQRTQARHVLVPCTFVAGNTVSEVMPHG